MSRAGARLATMFLQSDRTIKLDERSGTPSTSSDKAFLFTRDAGNGKTQLVVQFPSGATQVLATEP